MYWGLLGGGQGFSLITYSYEERLLIRGYLFSDFVFRVKSYNYLSPLMHMGDANVLRPPPESLLKISAPLYQPCPQLQPFGP